MRLAERVHAGAVGGIHRMQRLDGELHAGACACGSSGGNAVEHHLAGRRRYPSSLQANRRRRAPRQSAPKTRRPRRWRACCRRGSSASSASFAAGKKPPRQSPVTLDAVRLDDPHRLRRADRLGDLIAPRRDRGDAVFAGRSSTGFGESQHWLCADCRRALDRKSFDLTCHSPPIAMLT